MKRMKNAARALWCLMFGKKEPIANSQIIRRVEADFSPEAYEVLERIAENLGCSKADALRRAIGFMDFFIEETRVKKWTPILENGKQRKQIMTI